MRTMLIWSPLLACDRLAARLAGRRRLRQLRGSPAQRLSIGHIESLELLQLGAQTGVDVIYDIGAHVGTWTLLAKSLCPAAKIEAFEPLTAHCEAYEHAVSGLDGVRLHQTALGRVAATAPMLVMSQSDSSSFLPPHVSGLVHSGLKQVGSVSTPVQRLDDYREHHGLAPPDLLKLDVQGFELEVLAGAEKCVMGSKALILEVSFIEYYKGQCSFADVCTFLHQRGFELKALGVSTLLGRPLTQADALFMKF